MKRYVFLLLFILCIGIAGATLEANSVDYKWSRNIFGGGYSQVTLNLKNTGSSTEIGVLELAHKSQKTFSFVSPQSTCDPNFPNNVAVTYKLAPGEQSTITLKAESFNAGGTFFPALVHVDKCCTNGVDAYPCDAKEPFSWQYYLNDGNSISFNNAQSNALDQCDTAYEANEYLKSKGVYNCKDAVCQDAASYNSVAKCLDYGCINGEKQYDVCDNGESVAVRSCQGGSWELTGDKCGDTLPPEPPAPSSIKIEPIYIIAGAVVFGVGGYFGGLGVFGIPIGALIGLIVAVVI